MLTWALALMLAAQGAPPGDDAAEGDDAARTEGGEDRAGAAALISEGNKLLDAGRAKEALERFNDAYELFSSPTIYVSIAEAHLKLGNDVRAAEFYQRFLEEKAPGTAAKLVMLAEQRLEELATELAVVKVETAVEGALVSIDDDPIGETPLPPQYMKPGLYRVGATKEGHVPFSTTVELASGETRSIPMALELLPPPPEPKTAPPPPPLVAVAEPEPADSGSVLGRWWFWTAVGAAVAAGVTVGVVAGTSGGDSFVPGGELGLTGTSSWQKL